MAGVLGQVVCDKRGAGPQNSKSLLNHRVEDRFTLGGMGNPGGSAGRRNESTSPVSRIPQGERRRQPGPGCGQWTEPTNILSVLSTSLSKGALQLSLNKGESPAHGYWSDSEICHCRTHSVS